MQRRSLLAGLAASLVPVAVRAQEAVVIGHLSLADDPRYQQDWGYARLVLPPPVRTVEAAEMAIEDLAFVSEATGIAPQIAAHEVADLAGAESALDALLAQGAAFAILDLPGDMVAALAAQPREMTLLNATAPDDALRTACHAALLHSGPSNRMLMDALAQYLRAMDWTEILLLVGEDPRDAVTADVLIASAERLRLSIEDRRDFTLAADPSSREGNNVGLLTGRARYDVVFVADTRGEFGRYIPYATQLPRPVIGSVGLTPVAWHWAMERDGATQVSSRFDRAYGRKMSGEDWAVWVAVKSVLTAMTRAPDRSRAALTDFMRSDAMRLDGSKGVTLNYRSWDGQLRMPILLATSEAVIAVAPLDGYLHASNTLDTLGMDEAEFACN